MPPPDNSPTGAGPEEGGAGALSGENTPDDPVSRPAAMMTKVPGSWGRAGLRWLVFLGGRLASGLGVLVLISLLAFVLVRLAPGGPFSAERSLDPEIIRNLEAHYGLDRPPWEQYGRWMARALQGDLGPSYTMPDRTANEILAEGLPRSALLGCVAFFLALGLGIPLGVAAAWGAGTLLDRSVVVFTSLVVSFPSFIVAALLQWGVGFRLGWVPPAGWGDTWLQALLPSLALSLFALAFVARLVRSGLMEISREDWMRTARAKGLSRSAALLRHGLRVALIPVVAYAGPLAAGLLTGSFVVETIFAIPGLGRFFVTSVGDRDYTVVMALTLVYAALLLALDALADSLAQVLDPRSRG